MKRTIILGSILLAGSAILTTSCKKQEKGEEKADSTAVVSQKEEAKEDIPAEAEEEPGYASLDLQTFNLRGKVKDVKEYYNDEKQPARVLGFDQQGRLTTMTSFSFEGPVTVQYVYKNATSFEGDFKENEGPYARTELRRDKQNRLIAVPTSEFEYAPDGKLKEYSLSGWEDGTTYTKLTFDEKGNILTEEYKGEGEGSEWVGDNKYEYTAFDEKGNWTRCKVSDTGCFYDMSESADGKERETNVSTRRRVITYYE
ncbi:MAG: hypothetical protein MJZ60_04320 [Bacteroidaceae bacterium]|nr:hypothetical protein [Bacteroidaceae bacterium]